MDLRPRAGHKHPTPPDAAPKVPRSATPRAIDGPTTHRHPPTAPEWVRGGGIQQPFHPTAIGHFVFRGSPRIMVRLTGTEGFVKHIVKTDSDGLTIEISEIAEKKGQLLSEFQACREGRCSCPTDEYMKLESLEITARTGMISLKLKSKTGQVFDSSEIEKCLDHTESKLNPEN